MENSGLLIFENHSATRGVIFQTTAPVVPPGRLELSKLGDCWMKRSRLLIEISSRLVFESKNPRLEDGIVDVKRRNDSLLYQSALYCFIDRWKCIHLLRGPRWVAPIILGARVLPFLAEGGIVL